MKKLFFITIIFLNLEINCQNYSNIRNLVRIEKPTESDLPFIKELIKQLGFDHPIEVIQLKLKAYLEHPLDRVWIAKIPENKIIGLLALEILNPFYYQGLFAKIDSIVVDKNYRELGIGKILAETAEQYAKEIGCTRVILISAFDRKSAHEFYKKIGYKNNAAYFAKYFDTLRSIHNK